MIEALLTMLLIMAIAMWFLFKANKAKAEKIRLMKRNKIVREKEFKDLWLKARFEVLQKQKVTTVNDESALDALEKAEVTTQEAIDDEDSDYDVVNR